MIRVARPLAVLLGLSVLSSVLPLPSARGAVTREEVEREIHDAVEFHLEGLLEDGLPIPEPETALTYVDTRNRRGPTPAVV